MTGKSCQWSSERRWREALHVVPEVLVAGASTRRDKPRLSRRQYEAVTGKQWGRRHMVFVGQPKGGTMRSYAKTLPVSDDPVSSVVAADRSIELSRRALLQWGAGLLASATLAIRPLPLQAAPANRPSTSRASREQAIRQMPLRSLNEPIRSRIQKVVSRPTIYRRLPIEVIPCDPDLYLFLVRYPEVIVNMWQLMGVTKVVIKRTNAYAYDARDGAGTVSKVELVCGTRDQHLFLAEGYYDGPLMPRRVTGRCVLLLTSAYSRDAKQRSFVSNRLDVFVQVDKVGAEIVAKTLHPLMGRTIDTNFAESVRFVSQVSHVAESNGPGVQRLVSRLNTIEPEVRTQFAQIASAINQRAILKRFNRVPNNASQRISDLGSAPPQRNRIERK